MLDCGVVLAGRYRLEEMVGRGGMGEVWRATDQRLNRTVAVKALLPGQPAERFFAEAQTMAALRHPGIVGVYDFGDNFIVMEYVDGAPLSTLLEERGSLDVETVSRVTTQVAQALSAVHAAGIVHRDVKPGNIIIDDTGDAHLTDFGVAMSDNTSTVLGTARYMAPEQAMGHVVTPAADIYALGAVAYHCLAGRPPFDGEDAVQVALHHVQDDPEPLPESVPLRLRLAVDQAMDKDPLQRFASASAFADAVRDSYRMTLRDTQSFRSAAVTGAADPTARHKRTGFLPGVAAAPVSPAGLRSGAATQAHPHDDDAVVQTMSRRWGGRRAYAVAAGVGAAGILAVIVLNLGGGTPDPAPAQQQPAAPASSPAASPEKEDNPGTAPTRRTNTPTVSPTPAPAATRTSPAPETTSPAPPPTTTQAPPPTTTAPAQATPTP